MPDEQSNLNLPPAARRPVNRRRGRRGGRGRGRGPRPTEESAQSPNTGDVSTNADPAAESITAPEVQGDASRAPEVASAAPAPESAAPAHLAEEPAPPGRPQPTPPHRHERRPEPPPPKTWSKPADFRPADTSAIHQAVAHATEIAEGLRDLVDRIDEILELVEVAERQKLADERELDNLRRALRRIQPPRQGHSQEPHRSHSRGDSRPRQNFAPGRPEPAPAQEPSPEPPAHTEEAHESEAGFQGEPPSESHADEHGESHGENHGEGHGERPRRESDPEF